MKNNPVKIKLPLGTPKVSIKTLGAALVAEAKRPLPSNAPPEAKEAQGLMERWGEHLGGVEELSNREQADILSDLTDLDKKALVEEWLNSEEGFSSEFLSAKDPITGIFGPLNLETYQVETLRNDSTHALFLKSRRIGITWVLAMKGLVRGHLRDGHDSYYISKTEDDAKEIIKKARELYDTMPKDIRKALASRGVRTSLEFESSHGGLVSRLISHPQTEPRGIEGDIYLDEFAAYQKQEEIYTAATNCLVRQGRIWVISTPRYKDDIFYGLYSGELGGGAYQGHIYEIPWWECSIMVQHELFQEAQIECPKLLTAERVYKYGSERLIDVYEGNIAEHDFQVEYECEWRDDAASFYPAVIRKPCLFPVKKDKGFQSDIDQEMVEYEMETILKSQSIDTFFTKIPEELFMAVRTGRIGSRLFMGIDPGQTDGCGIVIVEETPEGMAVVRYADRFVGLGYVERENFIMKLGQNLPINRVAVDARDGEGRALVSRLRDNTFFGIYKIKAVEGSAKLNFDMAIDLKRRMVSQKIAIPDDEYLVADIGKVRTVALKNNDLTIEIIRNDEGHADQFYALIYACTLLTPMDGSIMLFRPDLSKVPSRSFNTIEPAAGTTRPNKTKKKANPNKRLVKSPRIGDFSDIKIDVGFGLKVPRP